MRVVFSIDPGLKGALAAVRDDGRLFAINDLPILVGEVNAPLLRILLQGFQDAYGKPEAVVVERQQSMPKQGVASSFKTGVGYGVILGVVAGMEIPLVIRSSNEWKPRLRLNKDKERSRKAAIERWPSQIEWFKLKKYEGRAEAALLGVSYLMESPQFRGGVGGPNVNSRRRMVRRRVDTQV